MTSQGVYEKWCHTCIEFPGGQHPPLQTHPVSSLVVARDGNVHMAQRRVRVTQSEGRQVNIRCLLVPFGGSVG